MRVGQLLRALFWMVAAIAAIETVSSHTVAAPPPAASVSSILNGEWVNGEPTTLTAQKGRVVVITFWTFGCPSCRRALPYWNNWVRQYGPGSDVAVLSVHTPEQPSEFSPDALRRFVSDNDLRFPVVTDNEYKTAKAFGVRTWPTTILLDKQGRVVGRWEGEMDGANGSSAYEEVERRIEALQKSEELPSRTAPRWWRR